MGEKTAISWTDHTFNPWWGCIEVSLGCDNCYAREFAKRLGLDIWGKGKPRRTFGDKHWNEPIRWDRQHAKEGTIGKVFCASMADVMDDEAPTGARERLWDLIDATPHLVWQLLTKRPQRYERYLPARFKHRNVWLGITAENQENFDIRVEHLHNAIYLSGLPVAWVSYEPALGPITLIRQGWIPEWFIFGGESGVHRRPCEAQWFRDLREEIEIRGYPSKLFVKQMSARTPAKGKALIPADMLIQEFPA